MSFVVPSWCCEEYLKDVIIKSFGYKNVKVENLVIQPAVSSGENYTSVLLRVHLNTIVDAKNRKNFSFIVKAGSPDETVSSALDEFDVLRKEMLIYMDVIKQCEQMLNAIGITQPLAPICYKGDNVNRALVMENLTASGYTVACRKTRLDLPHAKCALETLARFHATSMVLLDKQPSLKKDLEIGMFSRKSDALNSFFLTSLNVCCEEVATWPGFEKISEKLEKLKTTVIEKGRRVFDPNEKDLVCIVHGDFWTNNMMFKIDERSNPQNSKMIDFQVSCVGSPGIDLNYFFGTSLTAEDRIKNADELLQWYHGVLADVLKKLHYRKKIPTLLEIQSQFLEKGFYAFIATGIFLPIMLSEEPDPVDLNALLGVTEQAMDWKRRTFKNESFQKTLKIMLPVFDQKGFLD